MLRGWSTADADARDLRAGHPLPRPCRAHTGEMRGRRSGRLLVAVVLGLLATACSAGEQAAAPAPAAGSAPARTAPPPAASAGVLDVAALDAVRLAGLPPDAPQRVLGPVPPCDAGRPGPVLGAGETGAASSPFVPQDRARDVARLQAWAGERADRVGPGPYLLAGGQVELGVTGDPCVAADELRGLLERPDLLHVHVAPQPASALQDLADAVVESGPADAPGVVVAVPSPLGVVDVLLETDSPQARREVLARLPDGSADLARFRAAEPALLAAGDVDVRLDPSLALLLPLQVPLEADALRARTEQVATTAARLAPVPATAREQNGVTLVLDARGVTLADVFVGVHPSAAQARAEVLSRRTELRGPPWPAASTVAVGDYPEYLAATGTETARLHVAPGALAGSLGRPLRAGEAEAWVADVLHAVGEDPLRFLEVVDAP